MFVAMPCKEEEGEGQLTNEARAETELVRGYAVQGGRKRKSTDERSKSRARTCFVAMPCKEEEGRRPTDERSKSRDRTCFVAMPCKEEEGRSQDKTHTISKT